MRKLKERLDQDQGLPSYRKDHPVYYAGPAKTPAGYATGKPVYDDRWADG